MWWEQNANKNEKGKEETEKNFLKKKEKRKKRDHEKQIRKLSILKPPNPKIQDPVTQLSAALSLSFEI